MGSKSPKPLNEDEQKQLRSAFYDLEAQLKQANETARELRAIIFRTSSGKYERGSTITVVNEDGSISVVNEDEEEIPPSKE